jgi:hypothetical protein
VDLKQLPSEAFKRAVGPDGPYYEVYYHIAIVFGATMEFKLTYEGEVKGSVTARYDVFSG